MNERGGQEPETQVFIRTPSYGRPCVPGAVSLSSRLPLPSMTAFDGFKQYSMAAGSLSHAHVGKCHMAGSGAELAAPLNSSHQVADGSPQDAVESVAALDWAAGASTAANRTTVATNCTRLMLPPRPFTRAGTAGGRVAPAFGSRERPECSTGATSCRRAGWAR